jgi:tight adherence protein B
MAWIAAIVFGGVLALVIGAYWVFVVQQETKFIQRMTPRERLTAKKARGFLKPEERLSAVGSIDTVLHRTSRFTTPLQLYIQQSGMKLSVGTFVLASACVGLGSFVLVNLLTKQILLGLLAVPVGLVVPYLLVRRARNKRIWKFEEQFPEAIDLVARSLRAGHALPSGLSMVADEMAPPVGPEFRILYDEQNFGLTMPEALRNFAVRVPVLDARFFVTAVMTQREAGGNLAEVLDNLSSVIRERFKVKRQVRVISAHGRITGWILAALPPCVAAASFVLNPHHLQILLGDPIGIGMIEAALGMQVLGTLIVRKIVNIEY